MGLPKKRTSSRKRRMRRAHDFLTPQSLMPCPNCGEPTLNFRACPHCGMYKGKVVVEPKE